MKYLDQFRTARRCGAPIVVIRTADYSSAVQEIKKLYSDKKVPLLQWDICRGVIGVNQLGVEAASLVNDNDQGQPAAMVTNNPADALPRALERMPKGSVLLMLNLHIILESRDDGARMTTTQGVWNCRDAFKSSDRTLVILCPDLKIPSELSNDIVTIDVPLPTRDELGVIVGSQFKAAGVQMPEEPLIQRAIDAVSGLSEFSAEQAVAMSLSREGLDYESLWAQKRATIKQLGGLSVESRRVKFADLGGLFQVKGLMEMIIRGKNCPRLVVRLDEIDRQTSGTNDSSGVGGDAYGQLLTGMQDYGWDGILLPGFAGTGKTELGNAMGTEAGGLYLSMDLGGMLDKFVGESQKKIRAALRMLYAMGGEKVFFIGTTNRAEAIRPELKSRFQYGTIFFDLPTKEEQEPIWGIYVKHYGIKPQAMPKCVGWTGREIRACCKRADELGVSLIQAAAFISPVVKTMGDEVYKLRKSAHGKFLSASKKGMYDMNEANTETVQEEIRSIKMEEK
jgi:hypothetical protein